MPAAAVSNASRPGQRELVTRLDRLAVDLRESGIESPAIVMVGEVVKLSARLGACDEFQRRTLG
jgi:siroheme synthase